MTGSAATTTRTQRAATRIRARNVLAAGGNDTTSGGVAEDGYIAEWRALAELLRSGMPVEYVELLDDARFALGLADEAAALIGAAA